MKVSFSQQATLPKAISTYEKDIVMFRNVLPESQASGLARMDDFESEASWDLGGGVSLVLKFDGAKLSAEKREQLSRFRGNNRSVTLQLASGVTRSASIVGYGARDNTFYLTWA
jgi:hypothetical protein